MTGFGAASGEEGGASIRVELRSVNHRHLQVKARIPSEFASLESELEGLVRKKLARGSVGLNVSVQFPPGSRASKVQEDVARAYRDELEGLSKRLGLEASVGLTQILGLPGVLVPPVDDGLAERLGRNLKRLVTEAVKALCEMRAAEGAALHKDLTKNAAGLEKVVDRIEKRMPKVVEQHQNTLRKRVGELLGDASAVNPADLAREIAVIADKGDVSEEISRLRSHLEQLEAILAKGGAVGRRLDFLVQELVREGNTIGSKCSDATVAHWVVDAKTRIERLREQVQNVE